MACCIAWPEGRNCNWNPDKSTPHPLQTNQMLTNVWGNLLWGTLSGLLLIFARDLRPEKVCTEKATGGRQGLKADTSPRDWNILKPQLVFQHAPCSLPHLQNQNGLAQKIEPPEWVVSLFRKPSKKRAPQNSSQGPKERSGEFQGRPRLRPIDFSPPLRSAAGRAACPCGFQRKAAIESDRGPQKQLPLFAK